MVDDYGIKGMLGNPVLLCGRPIAGSTAAVAVAAAAAAAAVVVVAAVEMLESAGDDVKSAAAAAPAIRSSILLSAGHMLFCLACFRASSTFLAGSRPGHCLVTPRGGGGKLGPGQGSATHPPIHPPPTLPPPPGGGSMPCTHSHIQAEQN